MGGRNIVQRRDCGSSRGTRGVWVGVVGRPGVVGEIEFRLSVGMPMSIMSFSEKE